MELKNDWRVKVGEHLFEGLIIIIRENSYLVMFSWNSNRNQINLCA